MLLLPLEIANCGTDAVAERSLLSLDLQKAWGGANMLRYLRVDRKSGLKQAESAMAGPWKPWNDSEVGEYTQLNYGFLYQMYREGNGLPAGGTRERYLGYNGPDLRLQIASDLNLAIPNTVKIAVFDCETAQMNDPDAINYNDDTYYILVLPPTPRGHEEGRPPSDDYKEGQAWHSAWYHAMVDSLGM